MTEQPLTADGFTGYSTDDLAWFRKYYGTVEWMVHVVGPDEIYTHADPDLDEDDPGNAPFTEDGARKFAESTNRLGRELAARISGGEEHLPALHATVFHLGVPVAPESGPAR